MKIAKIKSEKTYKSANEALDAKFNAAKKFLDKVDRSKIASLSK